MEQYIAWRRATYEGNNKLASRALKRADPIVYKGILNELKSNAAKDSDKSEVSERWYGQLDDMVGLGLRAKFRENPALAHFLVRTHPKALGEASKDTRWGIGFTLTDSDALNTQKWPAEGNVMGKQLTIVRDEMLAEKNA